MLAPLPLLWRRPQPGAGDRHCGPSPSERLSGLQRGGTLVTVRCNEAKIDAVEDILRRHDPLDPAERSRAYQETG